MREWKSNHRIQALALLLTVVGCGGEPKGQAEMESSMSGTGTADTGNKNDADDDDESMNKEKTQSSDEKKTDTGGESGSTESDSGSETSQPEEDKPDNDNCSCEPNADLIYVMGDNTLMLFNPADASFKDLGRFECPFSLFEVTFSLGVDRKSRAWVQTRPAAELYRIDTLNKNECEEIRDFSASEEMANFGMAFVDKPNDGNCGRLFMHSFDGITWSDEDEKGKLSVMNPGDLSVSKVGDVSYNKGQITGTQDGRLFAIAGDPAKLIEYNPSNAEVLKVTELGKLNVSDDFAFAFWGGDFYFFTENDDVFPTKSKVIKLDYDGDGSLKTVVEEAPIEVVGAGVSVCAPLSPPPSE